VTEKTDKTTKTYWPKESALISTMYKLSRLRSHLLNALRTDTVAGGGASAEYLARVRAKS
jgi:hypothetical protein